MFKLISRNGGFETKLQALESPDSDKRARRKTRTKIGSQIVITEKTRNKTDEKENEERLNERTSLTGEKSVITFVETNGPKEEQKLV